MLRARHSFIQRALATAAILWLAASTARAQNDPAAAQALFDQAKELTRQGRLAEACATLQECNRLDPGIGTQFHLGDCYEQTGRAASAWAQFLGVASQARALGQVDRERAAQKSADRLEPRLPRLVVTVPEASKVPGLEIRRNGAVVGPAQWGTPVPVDPGEVEVIVTAPGRATLRQSLRLEEGNTATFSAPTLVAETSQPAPPGASSPAPAPATASAPPPIAPPRLGPVTSDDAPATGSRNTGWVLTLAGAGVVGLGVGTTFAILAKNQADDSKANCFEDRPNECSLVGVEQRNGAITKGNVATVATITGGVALAAAGVVWLFSGSWSEKKAQSSDFAATAAVAPGQAGVLVRGSF